MGTKKKSGFKFPVRFRLNGPLSGIPVQEDVEIEISSAIENALFLQCCELFRVIDLVERNLTNMVETYSKYRTRDPFRESLVLRFSGLDEGILSQIDPEIEIEVLSLFNRIHELRLVLFHADALPFTVRGEIEAEMGHLKKGWDQVRVLVETKLGWRLKSF